MTDDAPAANMPRSRLADALAGIGLRGLARWLAEGAAPAPALSPPPPANAAQEQGLPFAQILDSVPDPLLVASGVGRGYSDARRFVFANAAAKSLLRLQRSEGPLSTAVRAPEVLAAVDQALFEQEVGHALYQPGGVQDRVWRVRAEPLGAGGEGARLALITLRDETELRRSERTRADFLANASHELRTPLASLTGFIETLQGHARDDAVARNRFLAIMHGQAERMRRLIDDLMSLSRIELGEHIPPSGEVDLAVAAMDVIDALGPLAEERRLAFESVLPPSGAARLVGDRDQIVQVIQNLAENALKYTPAGGTVRVRVEPDVSAADCAAPKTERGAHISLLTPDHAHERRYAAISILDQGPGIARANLPRLTERFYRVEGQRSEHAGTGLGLAIVKHIVNRHRGGLAVESLEGVGARFVAYFPMTAERDQPSA